MDLGCNMQINVEKITNLIHGQSVEFATDRDLEDLNNKAQHAEKILVAGIPCYVEGIHYCVLDNRKKMTVRRVPNRDFPMP